MSFADSALMLAWIALVLLALGLSGVIRQIHSLTRDVRHLSLGPRVSRSQKDQVLKELTGKIPSDGTAVLLFVERDCEICESRIRDFEQAAEEIRSETFFAVVYSNGTETVASDRVAVLGGQQQLFNMLGIRITPFGLVIGEGLHAIDGRPVGSAKAVRELILQAEER